MRNIRYISNLITITTISLILAPTGYCSFPGGILVFAWDTVAPTTAPPSTSANLNGGNTLNFGTSNLVEFEGYYEAGLQTVEVATSTSGYLLRQSPTDPNAVNDPDSIYGNPRKVLIDEINSTVPVYFQFDPVITATAVVRDAWTMERLDNAFIAFAGTTAPNTGVLYTEYPWEASYAQTWRTDSEGTFPTNTILYCSGYDLAINREGYTPFFTNGIIAASASPGDTFDLGTLLLQPIDNNGNQIADAWEEQFFGAGANVATNEDADGDGMDNRAEYIAGTDPTDWYSCLWAQAAAGSNSFQLAWSTEPGRTYRITGTTNLCSDTWVQVAGSWEATNGQYEMHWEETNHHLSWCNSYRVEVMPYWWQGTNRVLVRTNDWPKGGGGTNTWTGGLPPIPGG